MKKPKFFINYEKINFFKISPFRHTRVCIIQKMSVPFEGLVSLHTVNANLANDL